MESNPLYYRSAVGTFIRFPAGCTSKHANVAEATTHFWCMGSSLKEFLTALSIRAMEKYHYVFMVNERGEPYQLGSSGEEGFRY